MEKQNKGYEIIWITNPDELKNNKFLVSEFFKLYRHKSNFPDKNEREESRFIKGRIKEKSDDPHTHLMAFNIIENDIKIFVAGCIVEYYPDSRCVLVTYVFVNKKYRGLKIGFEKKRIGEILLKSEDGLAGLVKFFETKYNSKPAAVLFESNNPYETEKDSMPPAKRLKFFKSLGAKRINFSYIQPPLDDDKGIVTNLYLLTFPDLVGLKDKIPSKTIMSFIMELAKSLDRNKEVGSKAIYGLDNYKNDLKLLLSELKIDSKIDNFNFVGLYADGRNILKDTFNNLMSNSDKNGFVDLTDIPGAAE